MCAKEQNQQEKIKYYLKLEFPTQILYFTDYSSAYMMYIKCGGQMFTMEGIRVH